MQSTLDERPFAQPVDYVRPAPKAIEVVFPVVAMPRSLAAVDVVVMVSIFMVGLFLISFSSIAQLLMERWPQFGIFIPNLLLGVLTLGAIAALLAIRNQSAATIGLSRTSWQRVCAAAAITVPTCYAAGMISNLLYIAVSGFDVDGFMAERAEFMAVIPEIPMGWAVLFSIFVGIHEEVFFRGFMLSRLRTLCRSNAAAIILTSAVFGGLHFYQGPAGVFQTAAVGLVMAIIVTYARTLWPAIIAHAVFDTIGLVIAGPLTRALEEYDMLPAMIGSS